MYCGLSVRVIVVGSFGSRGSQGRASKSSSFSPAATNFGGCEWLSMALILLISASNWGSAVWARSPADKKTARSATAVLLVISKGNSPERCAERVNRDERDCKSSISSGCLTVERQ